MNAQVTGKVRRLMQGELFAAPAPGPQGFGYHPDFISAEEEAELVGELRSVTFAPFDFHGHLAHRHVAGFGYRYDYASRSVRPAQPIPGFLEPLRRKVGVFTGLPAEAFEQILINAYRPGAGIGWHKDKPHFEIVVGISLLSACSLRFRRAVEGGWERISVPVEPRSAYVLGGVSRLVWEHSIRPLHEERYSITLRTLATPPP